MGAYDKTLDERSINETVQVADSKLTVSVYSYNGGTPKVQISRSNKNDQSPYGWTFSKLGRITGDEVEAILPVLEKALEDM